MNFVKVKIIKIDDVGVVVELDCGGEFVLFVD